MASGTTDPTTIRFATAQDEFPSLELLLFGPVTVGQLLLVTVIEENLFKHGELASLHQEAFSRFNGFGPQIMPNELNNIIPLITDGENGLLMQLALEVLGEVPAAAKPIHRKWAFSKPSSIVTCNPEQALVQLVFGVRDMDNNVQFAPEAVIRIPRVVLAKTLRLYIVVSDFETGELVYSNGLQNNPRNRMGRPTLVSPKAPQGSFRPKVTGSGIGGGDAPPNPSVEVTDDMTGLFEAYLDATTDAGDGVLPALLVQLNQAGRALAGWFCLPPVNITGHPHLGATRGAVPPPLSGIQHGVLLGQLTPDAKFNWGPVPDENEDPSLFFIKSGHTGKLEVVSREVVGMRLKMTLRRQGNDATLFLRRVDPTPRWSAKGVESIVARVDPSAGRGGILATRIRDGIRAAQFVPVPLMFWNKLGVDMTEDGVLGKLIIDHRRTSGAARNVARGKINNYLQALTGAERRYRELIKVNFLAKAVSVDLQIGEEIQTVYDWLTLIQKELIGDIDKGADPRVVLESFTDPGFREMGVVPLALFEYEFEFLAAGTNVPLPKGFAAGAYLLAVKFSRSTLIGEETNEAWKGGKKTFTKALFGDIGLSLDTKLKPGPDANTPTAFVFRTAHDLDPTDFDRASFYTITGSLLSVRNTFFKARGPSSAVMVLTVPTTKGRPAEAQLVAGSDKWYSPPKLTSQQFRRHDERIRFTLASVMMGWGYFIPGIQPVDAPPPGEVPVKEELGKALVEVTAFFRRNSATLESRSLAAVEEAFAVEKAMFVSGGGRADSIGHASPEGPDNSTLSRKRAEEIVNAAKRAFGAQFALDPVSSIGRGSVLAESEGMLKPPVLAARQREFDEQYEVQFPRFRFVLLSIEGVPVLRVQAAQVTPGG